MLELTTPIQAIPRIRKTTAEKFASLGLHSVEDLLWHRPFRYDDFSSLIDIRDITPGTQVTFRGTVKSVHNRNAWRRKLRMTEAILSDETGSIVVLWFNQPYLTRVVAPGDILLCSGKAKRIAGKLTVSAPAWEKEKTEQAHVGRIIPVYSTTKDLTVKTVRAMVQRALPAVEHIPEILPDDIMQKRHILRRAAALQQLHYPDSMEALKDAKRRFTYEDLLLIQIAVSKTKKLLQTLPGHAIPHDNAAISAFLKQFPFTITADQKKAAWKILQDMARPQPMNRLLQGDVGSGKTLVAEIALFSVAHSGLQAALLAPTELLARQHAERISTHLATQHIRTGFVSGTTASIRGDVVTRTAFERAVAAHEIDVIIGTHALLNERISLEHLGLIVIDEQHRFGVEQRKILREQAMERHHIVPHFLSMTATPIPRSLSLTLYGDLDLTLISEMPTGEKKITTEVLAADERERGFTKIEEIRKQGKQSFIVYPVIDPSETLAARAATEEYERLAEIFPKEDMGLLHGRMNADKKQRVLDAFSKKNIHILVTTSVIEVGIDVPDASVMMIEGAERFGLAQLHQLRGRIGRAGQQAYCFLTTEQKNPRALNRLRLMEQLQDGFALAEKDLELRGPGELFGTAQSGYSGESLLHLTDIHLIAEAQEDAAQLLDKDPTLQQYPELQKQLQEKTVATHFE